MSEVTGNVGGLLTELYAEREALTEAMAEAERKSAGWKPRGNRGDGSYEKVLDQNGYYDALGKRNKLDERIKELEHGN